MFYKTKEIKSNPSLLKAASLLLIANADGIIAKEEAVYLSIILGKNTTIIFEAEKYIKQNSINIEYDNLISFINEIKLDLDKQEISSLIVNMIDLMYIDGDINKEQERLIKLFVNLCDVDINEYNKFREVIELKFNLIN